MLRMQRELNIAQIFAGALYQFSAVRK